MLSVAYLSWNPLLSLTLMDVLSAKMIKMRSLLQSSGYSSEDKQREILCSHMLNGSTHPRSILGRKQNRQMWLNAQVMVDFRETS